MIDRLGGDRIDIGDRLARVAQRAVDRVSERVDRLGLALAGDHEPGAAMRGEIFRDAGDPFQRFGIEAAARNVGRFARSRADGNG